MDRRAQRAFGRRDQLTFQDALADADDGLCRIANVLCDRQNQSLWNWDRPNRLRSRCRFMTWQTQATVQFAQVVSWRTHGSARKLMQSTGQGATHNSQPVHSPMMIVCIS